MRQSNAKKRALVCQRKNGTSRAAPLQACVVLSPESGSLGQVEWRGTRNHRPDQTIITARKHSSAIDAIDWNDVGRAAERVAA